MKIEDSFYIGYITKTRGLKGEVQAYFEYEEPEELDLDTIFVEINGKLVPFFTSAVKMQANKTAYLYLEDITTIDQAAQLVKKSIYLPNSKTPQRNADEFRYTDLEGFIVHDANHGELGEIIAIHEYPQQLVAVVAYQFREIMFPLNDDFIDEIDEEAGILHVNLPDGLLDVYLGS